MAIQITKKKTLPQTEAKLLASPLAPSIDAAGKTWEALDKARAALSAKAAKEMLKVADLEKRLKQELAELQQEANEVYAAEDADTKFTVAGAKHQIEIGKAGNQRKITDMPTLQKLFDDHEEGLFVKLASVKLGDVDAYLTPEEKELVLENERTARPVKLERKV